MNKIIKNKYIWNLIVFNISKLNDGYVRYNYYDIPLEIVIKSRNQQLFKEKLENYSNHYLNGNSTESDHDNSKHFIYINEMTLIELFKWKELPMQLFELFFHLFKQEIAELKYTLLNISTSNYSFGKIPLYKYLIDTCDINKLEYLYDNEWIDVEMFQTKHISNFLYIDENKKKIRYISKETPFKSYVLVNNLNYKQLDPSIILDNNIRMYNLFINKMKIKLPLSTIYNLLVSIMDNKQEQLQQGIEEGKEMYEKLSNMYIDLLPDELPLLSIHNQHNYIASLMEAIIGFNDMYMLVLLLNKYKYNGAPKSNDIHTIYGVEIHGDTLKYFNISGKVISSKFLELMVYLAKNRPNILKNLEFAQTETHVHDPEIACQLVESFKISNSFYINIKLSPMCCHLLTVMGKRKKIKLETSRKWSSHSSYNNGITIDFLNRYTQLDSSCLLLDDIIKTGDLKLISKFIEIYSNRFTIENSTLILVSQLPYNDSILSHLLDLLIDSNFNYYYPTLYFLTIRGYLISLLIYSIKYNQKSLFGTVANKIRKLDDQHTPNSEIEYSIYDKELFEFHIENPRIVKSWLKGSRLQKEYFKLINSNLSKIIYQQTFQNYSSFKFSSSYYLIGEITSINSQPQILEPYQSLKSVQYNIVSMAANIGIVFTNTSNQHSTSQFELSNENTLKSIYRSKGFLKNLLNPNYKPPYKHLKFENNPTINYYQNQKDKSIVTNNVLIILFKIGFLTIIDLDIIIHYSLKLSNSSVLDLLCSNGIYKNVYINSFPMFYPSNYFGIKYKRHQFLNYLNYKIENNNNKNKTQCDNLILDGGYNLVF